MRSLALLGVCLGALVLSFSMHQAPVHGQVTKSTWMLTELTLLRDKTKRGPEYLRPSPPGITDFYKHKVEAPACQQWDEWPAVLTYHSDMMGELLGAAPYAYHLHRTCHKVSVLSMPEMREVYFFADRHETYPDNTTRSVPGRSAGSEAGVPPLAFDADATFESLDKRVFQPDAQWEAPPLKELFANTFFTFEKPVVVVVDAARTAATETSEDAQGEQNGASAKPETFSWIPMRTLRQLIDVLARDHTVIFARVSLEATELPNSFADDAAHEASAFFAEYKGRRSVYFLHELYEKARDDWGGSFDFSFLTFQMWIYANAQRFVCIAGPPAVLPAYMAGKAGTVIVYHPAEFDSETDGAGQAPKDKSSPRPLSPRIVLRDAEAYAALSGATVRFARKPVQLVNMATKLFADNPLAADPSPVPPLDKDDTSTSGAHAAGAVGGGTTGGWFQQADAQRDDSVQPTSSILRFVRGDPAGEEDEDDVTEAPAPVVVYDDRAEKELAASAVKFATNNDLADGMVTQPYYRPEPAELAGQFYASDLPSRDSFGCEEWTDHSDILEFHSEFGMELIVAVPYAYYLHTQCKRLSVISTRDTKPLYFFVDDHKTYTFRQRRYDPREKFACCPMSTVHVRALPKAQYTPPPYKSFFKNNFYVYDKPILVITNKYQTEWSGDPVNHIPLDALVKMVDMLKDNFTIVYSRPTGSEIQRDGSAILDYPDKPALKGKVLLIEDLWREARDRWGSQMGKDLTFNLFQFWVYSNCDNFVSVQGGNSVLTSFMAGPQGKVLVYLRAGHELRVNAIKGWYGGFSGAELHEAYNAEDLLHQAAALFLPAEVSREVVRNLPPIPEMRRGRLRKKISVPYMRAIPGRFRLTEEEKERQAAAELASSLQEQNETAQLPLTQGTDSSVSEAASLPVATPPPSPAASGAARKGRGRKKGWKKPAGAVDDTALEVSSKFYAYRPAPDGDVAGFYVDEDPKGELLGGAHCEKFEEHPETLDFHSEFGMELIIATPYVYHLRQNCIVAPTRGTPDTSLLYYWSFQHQEKFRWMREFKSWEKFEGFPLSTIHVDDLPVDTFAPPPYKQVFMNKYFVYEKPLLVITNKYQTEWGGNPVNFIPLHTLEAIARMLSAQYTVVYSRPTEEIQVDKSEMLEYGDKELMRSIDGVVLIEDLWAAAQVDLAPRVRGMTFNLFQFWLYANCDKFISVQGGNSVLTSYMAGANGTVLVYIQAGNELKNKAIDKWYARFSGANVIAIEDPDDLFRQAAVHFAPSEADKALKMIPLVPPEEEVIPEPPFSVPVSPRLKRWKKQQRRQQRRKQQK